MLKRLDRYVLRQIINPLVMTLGVAALLLLLERMLRLFDFVVNQGGPVRVVFRMLGTLVPHYLGLALPLGLFLGILLAFRKLSMSSELDAMRSGGIGLPRMLKPVMTLTLALMIINLLLVGFVQPYSRYIYRSLVFDLRSGALGASVKVGEFVDIGNNLVLRIEESRNNGAELIGIFMERTNVEGRRITITAERGGFFATGDQQNVILRLYNGRLIETEDTRTEPRILTFDQQDLTVNLPSIAESRERGEEQLELTLPELYGRMNDPLYSISERNSYRANFHWRLLHTLTFILLPLVAIPLGITNKRTGKSTGLVVGLALLIVYNELTEVGENIVSNGGNPFIALWGLYTAFAALGLRLFCMRAFVVGAEPLQWLDAAWSKFSKTMKRFSRQGAPS